MLLSIVERGDYILSYSTEGHYIIYPLLDCRATFVQFIFGLSSSKFNVHLEHYCLLYFLKPGLKHHPNTLDQLVDQRMKINDKKKPRLKVSYLDNTQEISTQ